MIKLEPDQSRDLSERVPKEFCSDLWFDTVSSGAMNSQPRNVKVRAGSGTESSPRGFLTNKCERWSGWGVVSKSCYNNDWGEETFALKQ